MSKLSRNPNYTTALSQESTNGYDGDADRRGEWASQQEREADL